MASRTRYEPVPRRSSDSLPLCHDDSNEEFKDKPVHRTRRISALIRKFRRFLSRACRPLYISIFLSTLLLWQVFFNAPYANSRAPKFEIDGKETVFIAANIIDADLITGAWGRSLLQLVESIGKDRVFVSIYGGPTEALRHLESMLECESKIVSEEEDPLSQGTIPRTTLPTGEKRVKRIAFLAEVRNKALEPMEKDEKGRKWDKVLFINDVYFEAEGALRLLWGTNVNAEGKSEYKAMCAADFVTSWKYYDTFATRDAEGFSIGVPIFPWFSAEGEAATRKDLLAGKDAVRVKSCWGGMVAFDGRYFQNSTPGEWASISAGKHGNAENTEPNSGIGMPKLPLRFRSEPEPFWDSSECCLIHADIMSLPPFPGKKSYKAREEGSMQNHRKADKYDTGIYMNPFVRVAYDASSFKHIWITKRFERLFALPQRIINGFAHMPRWNYRRAEEEGQLVPDKLWISANSDLTEAEAIVAASNLDFEEKKGAHAKRATLGHVQSKEWWAEQGHYAQFNRTARRGGYCGVRQLLVVKEGTLKEGEGNWDNLLSVVPPVDV